MDFSDLGGVPVGQKGGGEQFTRVNSPTPPAGGGIDFSDLGGTPVVDSGGALEASARGALRNFPLAQQAAAAIAPVNPFSEKETYGEELRHLTRAAEASKAAHPVAYGTGAVAGTVAPLLIPGVGAGLEAAPILGNAALGMIGSQSDTDLTAPTLDNAKDAAIAGTIGAAAGGIGKGIRALAPSAQDIQAGSTAAGIGTTPRKLLGSGFMGKNPQADLADLGEWINRAGPGGKPLIALADKPGEILSKVQHVHDVSGAEIGALIDRIAPDTPIPAAGVTSKLHVVADELNIISPEAEKKVLNLITKINNLQGEGKLNFDNLYKLKGLAWKAAKNDENVIPAYGVIADHINGMVDEFGAQIGDKGVRAAYEVSKHNYKNASRLLPILRYAEAKEIAGGPLGNAGLLGLFGLGAGVASGNPIAGAAAMAASSVGRPIANQVGRNAMMKTVPYMPQIAAAGNKLNTAAQLELTNALESKFGKKGK
jgi:hypothetical protein